MYRPVIEPVEVTDPTDPRLADFIGLRDRDLTREADQRGEGIFIAEGVTVIRRLLASGQRVRSVLVTPRRYRELISELGGVLTYLAPQDVLNGVVGFNLHRGAVAAGERRPLPPAKQLIAAANAVAVLEGINDHENLGAIFRSASALGVEAMLLDPSCADPYYRRCIRVSMGEVLFVPFARLSPWPKALESLAAEGFELIALTPLASTEPIDRCEPKGKIAVLVGAEGPGLSAAALASAHRQVHIPMTGGADSLNVGHAAAIAFHRLVSGRRRSQAE